MHVQGLPRRGRDHAYVKEYIDSHWIYLCKSIRPRQLTSQHVSTWMERFCRDLPCVGSFGRSRAGNWVLKGREGSRRAFRFSLSCHWFHEYEPVDEEAMLAACKARMASTVLALNRSRGSLFHFTPEVNLHGIDVADVVLLIRKERANRALTPELECLLTPEGAKVFREKFFETESLIRRLPELKRRASAPR